jgi:ankyrin repeat protein
MFLSRLFLSLSFLCFLCFLSLLPAWALFPAHDTNASASSASSALSMHVFSATITSAVPTAPPLPSPVPPVGLDPERGLWNAVANGDATRVEELLRAGADPTLPFQGRTLLELAAQNSLHNRFFDLVGVPNPWVLVIETLLQYGADPAQKNAEGRTPYEYYEQLVIWYPNPDIARLLNPSPPSPKTLQNLLRFAVCAGDPVRTELRIEQGANPRALSYGRTFLELAAHNSNKYKGEGDWKRVIRILLKHGANPNQVDDGGMTAHEQYVQLLHPQPEIMELLGA